MSVVSSHSASISKRMLSHSPMSLMSLTCSLELSDRALLVATALQCGMPIPLSCVRFPLPSTSVAHDPFGHWTLNSNRNTARYYSHNLIVRELTSELSLAGLQASCAAGRVPRATTLTNSQLIGDIAIFNSDISTDSYYPQHSPVVLDVSLTHSGQQVISDPSAFVFRDSSVSTVEHDKLRKYYSHYRTDSCGFIPVIADTYGRLGPKALRLFKRISDLFQSGSSSASSQPVSASHPTGSRYHALRLRVLRASLEASAARLLCCWGVLQPGESDLGSQPVSTSSPSFSTSPFSLSRPLAAAPSSFVSPTSSPSLPSRLMSASTTSGSARSSVQTSLLVGLAAAYASASSSPAQQP